MRNSNMSSFRKVINVPWIEQPTEFEEVEMVNTDSSYSSFPMQDLRKATQSGKQGIIRET